MAKRLNDTEALVRNTGDNLAAGLGGEIEDWDGGSIKVPPSANPDASGYRCGEWGARPTREGPCMNGESQTLRSAKHYAER